MTPDERDWLHHFGESVLFNLAVSAADLLLYGILVIVFLTTACRAAKQGLKSYSQRILFACSAFSLLSAGVIASTNLAIEYVVIHIGLDSPGMPWDQRKSLYNILVVKLCIAYDWAWALLPFFSDSITIWRGVVLFPEQHWGFMVAFTLGVAGMAIIIVETGLYTHDPYGDVFSEHLLDTLDAVGIMLSFLANLIATSLIAYRIWWLYRHFLITQLNREDRQQFRLYKVLHLLVESGLAYCILQAITMVLAFLPQPEPLEWRFLAFLIFEELYIMVSAMYPALVTLVIKHRGNFVENYSYNSP